VMRWSFACSVSGVFLTSIGCNFIQQLYPFQASKARMPSACALSILGMNAEAFRARHW
jgi:hypothetical protein